MLVGNFVILMMHVDDTSMMCHLRPRLCIYTNRCCIDNSCMDEECVITWRLRRTRPIGHWAMILIELVSSRPASQHFERDVGCGNTVILLKGSIVHS